MRKNLLLILVLAALSACASTSPDPEPRDRGRRPRDFGGMRERMASPDNFSLPSGWWHDPHLAEPLALTPEQFQRLDALTPQQEQIARLENDGMLAQRELRNALESKNASAAEITTAGRHIREMHDSLFDQQIALLAAQREILTLDQWQRLQSELVEERRPQYDRGGRGSGRGGMGGRGGGRRPGAW